MDSVWSDSPRVTDNLIIFVIELPPEVAQESLFQSLRVFEIDWFRKSVYECTSRVEGVAINRSNFSDCKDRGRTFWSNCRDRMGCGRIAVIEWIVVEFDRTGRKRSLFASSRLTIIMWGIWYVCTLALTLAKTSSHYDCFAIFVPARSLLLFDVA